MAGICFEGTWKMERHYSAPKNTPRRIENYLGIEPYQSSISAFYRFYLFSHLADFFVKNY
jgi:hypothetical protein